MTPLQKAVLDEIVAYRASHGFSPTHDELKRTFGMASRSGPAHVLAALVRRGHLIRRPGLTRNYEPTRAALGACNGAPPGAVVDAARRLLANLIEEDVAKGVALVRRDDLGDLDIALAELAADPDTEGTEQAEEEPA